MKLVYEFEGDRATKCYYLNDGDIKEYVDHWYIKTDVGGRIQKFDTWKPKNLRKQNYPDLKQTRKVF